MPIPKISKLKKITPVINHNIFNSQIIQELNIHDHIISLENSEDISLENFPLLKLSRKKGGYYGRCNDESNNFIF